MVDYEIEDTTARRVTLTFECPYCEDEQSFEYGIPIPAGSKRACSECGRTLKVTPSTSRTEYGEDEIEDTIVPWISSMNRVKEFSKETGKPWKLWVYGIRSVIWPALVFVLLGVPLTVYYGAGYWQDYSILPLFVMLAIAYVIPAIWSKCQKQFLKRDAGYRDMTIDHITSHRHIYEHHAT